MLNRMQPAQDAKTRQLARRNCTDAEAHLGSRLLPLHPVLTPLTRRVERVVMRLARAHQPMPNNPVLGELAGGHGRPSALRALRRLSTAGIVEVEHVGKRRRVIVLATGESTDWGEAKPGHSPFINRRGEAVSTERPAKLRMPLSRALPPQPVPALTQPTLAVAHRSHLPQRRVFASSCQYPMWADGERPGTHPLFCNEATEGTADFCRVHVKLCFQLKSSRHI